MSRRSRARQPAAGGQVDHRLGPGCAVERRCSTRDQVAGDVVAMPAGEDLPTISSIAEQDARLPPCPPERPVRPRATAEVIGSEQRGAGIAF
jgi:hypothetical protein